MICSSCVDVPTALGIVTCTGYTISTLILLWLIGVVEPVATVQCCVTWYVTHYTSRTIAPSTTTATSPAMASSVIILLGIIVVGIPVGVVEISMRGV